MEKFYKVKNVYPLPDYNLLVDFLNGETKTYNINPLFSKWDVFNSLTEIEGLYEQVKVDQEGYGISWNEFIDLSCNELYINGVIDS